MQLPARVYEVKELVVSNQPIISAVDLKRYYSVSKGLLRKAGVVKALDGVSFELAAGKTLAVVGESGCGKSTLARLVAMIEHASAGELLLDGKSVYSNKSASNKIGGNKIKLNSRETRQAVQVVFQDPYASLNPRHKIGTILEEPLALNSKMSAEQRRSRAESMMQRVGLRPEHYERYPHMFSGGQRQRIAIARAMILNPRVLVLDEPVSALDLSIQAQVLNLLAELQREFGLAYIFISHDLSVVRHIADYVMVMYLGKVVEAASVKVLFSEPRHPYTVALLSATPTTDSRVRKKRLTLKGELPSPLDPPDGCAFNPRCPNASKECRKEQPALKQAEDNSRQLACFHPMATQ